MANSFVQVPPDSTGKDVQTFSNVIGGATVHAQATSLVDALGIAITALTGGATPQSGMLMGGSDGTHLRAFSTDSSGNLNVNIISGGGGGGNAAAGLTGSTVPTSADYVGYNSGGNLIGVSTANALPVAQQGSVAVTGTFWQTTQPVSGTVSISGTLSDNITQFGGNAIVTGTGASGVGIPRVTVSNDSNILATQSGTWTVQPGNTANTTAWLVTGTGGTFPVTGTVTTTPPANASTNIAQVGGSAVSLGQNTMVNSIPVAIASNQAAIPVSQNGAPWQDNITQFGSSAVVTGTGASGAGIPRVTVSNDSNILATQSGTWTVTGAGGTFPVTGSVTANQGGAPWSQNLTQVAGSAISLGQAIMASSLPVVIASNQSTLPVSIASLPLSTNAAQETGGNLASINTILSAGVPQDQAAGPTEVPAPAFAVLVAGKEDTGDMHALNVDGFGNLSVNISQPIPTIPSLPTNAAQETGGNLANIANKLLSGIAIIPTVLEPNASQEAGGNLAQMTQTLTLILLEVQKHTVLLKAILAATGNDVPDDDQIGTQVLPFGYNLQQ
jgi:hypothetical protein